MKRTPWTPTLAWLAAAAAALAFAVAGPNEVNVMGRLPAPTAQRLDAQRVVLLQGLSGERTLALVAFHRDHRTEIDSWIQGLRLDQDSSIPWLKMPVLSDPGSADARNAIETRILARHASDAVRSRLVPIFTDREAFIRAAGLSGAGHASVLVLDRNGKVLARAEGAYDRDKAAALRETLLARSD
jgi:hypothetical protein